MLTKSISLFFPMHNEEKNIVKLVNAAGVLLSANVRDYEIIIVDDGSSDGTPQIADRMARDDGKIRVIHHPKNLGYGAALRTGFIAAKNELILFTDADLQFDIGEMKYFLECSEQYECVIGYRLKRADDFRRKIYAKGWMFLVRLLFGLRVKDLDCGFKLFSRRLMDKIKFVSCGAVSTTEILVQIKRMGVPMKEIGVNHFPREHGQQSGARYNVVLTAFIELIQLYFRLSKIRKSSSLQR